MTAKTLFPRLLAACATLLIATSAMAQQPEADPHQTNTTTNSKGSIQLETEPSAPVIVEERRPRSVVSATGVKRTLTLQDLNLTDEFDQNLLTAIQSHLGATYRFNTTGPNTFDCSGLVWRSFQDVGVNFQRGPARSYWATFAAPPKGEQFKFGTLVFFSGLRHVGIVVDEKGFYHSSRHHGVIYSPFNDYWLSRIDGFRRVAFGVPTIAAKQRQAKPVASTQTSDEGTPH